MKNVIVVATGRPIERSHAEAVIELVRDSNLDLKIDFDELSFTKFGHFAGHDEDRAAALQHALSGRNYDAVWLARGGYGTGRLLSKIKWTKVDKNVSVYGYSDGCFLLAALFRIGCTKIFHAPMPIDIVRPDNLDHMKRVISAIATGESDKHIPANFLRGNRRNYNSVFVSNMTVLTKLIGTRFEPKLNDGLLIVEDVSEYEYSIDRMFFQLSNSKLGRSIAGIGLGAFSNIPENDVKFNDKFSDMLRYWFPEKENLYENICVGHIAKALVVNIGSSVKLHEL